MFKRLFNTKTFWGAVAAIVAATEQIATGKATIAQGLQIIAPALLAIFIRDGVAKLDEKKEEAAGPDLKD